MRLTCPLCGASGDLAFWVVDEAERHAIGIALAIPRELRVQVLGYLKLFEPEKRRLSVTRAAKILGELESGISAAQITYKGKTWAAPMPYWGDAMDIMLLKRDSFDRPMANHNYLYSIISGMSGKAESKQGAKAEEAKRHRPIDLSANGGKVIRKPGMPSHISNSLDQFRKKEEQDHD